MAIERAKKVNAERQAKTLVTRLRMHWLQQFLDWQLSDGEKLADRFSKQELSKLTKAAKDGKLFFGS